MDKEHYTIGEVSEMFDLPISTLRYYDRQGLILHLEKSGGQRRFSKQNIESLRVIECLKASGLEISEIRKFMQMCEKGNESLQERKDLFEKRRETVLQQIEQLQNQLDMIDYKCWYYQTAVKINDEKEVQSMIPDRLPEQIRKKYDACHQQDKNV